MSVLPPPFPHTDVVAGNTNEGFGTMLPTSPSPASSKPKFSLLQSMTEYRPAPGYTLFPVLLQLDLPSTALFSALVKVAAA